MNNSESMPVLRQQQGQSPTKTSPGKRSPQKHPLFDDSLIELGQNSTKIRAQVLREQRDPSQFLRDKKKELKWNDTTTLQAKPAWAVLPKLGIVPAVTRLFKTNVTDHNTQTDYLNTREQGQIGDSGGDTKPLTHSQSAMLRQKKLKSLLRQNKGVPKPKPKSKSTRALHQKQKQPRGHKNNAKARYEHYMETTQKAADQQVCYCE